VQSKYKVTTPARRNYLDWMRGLAVLIMIEAHVVDAWTRSTDRVGIGFRNAIILGGFGAPLFLFLAGVAVVLAAESRQRRLGSASLAAAATRRRGWEIFGLAFLFRLQAYLLSPGATLRGILKVDILNIMGPAIVAAATIWQYARTARNRAIAFAVATLAFAMATPLVRTTGWLDPLPDPLEWYFRPVPGRTTFTLFPWAGFVMAGGLAGLFLERANERGSEARVMAGIVTAGVVLVVVGYATSLLPTIYAASSFWTSSPTFFILRTGVLFVLIPIAWFWRQRYPSIRWPAMRHRESGRALGWHGAITRESPFEVFGRSSLFVYWIHVEMVYGFVSRPLHRALSLRGSLIACVAFSAFLYGLVLLKNRFATRFRPTSKPIAERLAQT
jgi:uncharacterized membrane protein